MAYQPLYLVWAHAHQGDLGVDARSPAVYTCSLSPFTQCNDSTHSAYGHIITISNPDALAVSVPGISQDSDHTRRVQE